MNTPRPTRLVLAAVALGASLVACSSAPGGEADGTTNEAMILGRQPSGPVCTTPLGDGSWSSAADYSPLYYTRDEINGFILDLQSAGCVAPGYYLPQASALYGTWYSSCPAAILNKSGNFPPGAVAWMQSGGCVAPPVYGNIILGWNFLEAPSIVGKGCAVGACSTPPGSNPIY
jgi:hypothetical protein